MRVAPRAVALSIGALLAALLFVLAVAARTGTMAPRWDGLTYVRMAQSAPAASDSLVAPFAYRPGMPWLARGVSAATGVSIVQGFRIVGFAAAALLLVLAFFWARRRTGYAGPAAFVAACVGLSFVHVKFPLYFSTLVDVAAYPFLVAALWMGLERRYTASLVTACAGLFFKEFLIIPVVLLVYLMHADQRLRPDTRRRREILAVVLGLGVFLVPRLAVPVAASFQEIDPLHDPASLRRLVANPLNWKLHANIAYAWAGYWLPTLLLCTRERVRAAWRTLDGIRGWLALYLILVWLMTLYGGTNIFVFVSYAVGAQILVLSALLRRRIPRRELALVLAALVVYNRIPWAIPDPAVSFDRYIDFTGGWATRLPMESGLRVLEMAGYGAAMMLLRRLWPPREA